MPVYNVEKYLEKCMASLLCQKGCEYEILLLDDGSTDSSGTICDHYAQMYPDIVRVIHKSNEGLLMTRRRGFAEAHGDWFICVDSDDCVSPLLLETVVNTINSQPDCDMVMFNFEYYDETGTHRPSRLKLQDGTVFAGQGKQAIYEKRLLSVDVNMMWMRAIKRGILDMDADYGNCGIRNMCEDAVQVMALYTAAQKIVYRDVPLYYYRKGDDSITAKQTMANWEASWACFAYTRKYLPVWNVGKEVELRYYTQHLENIANYIRWLITAEEKELPASAAELLAELKREPGYITCRQNYCREYAHSQYMAMLVPVLNYLVDKENLAAIRLVFALENKLLRFRRHQ